MKGRPPCRALAIFSLAPPASSPAGQTRSLLNMQAKLFGLLAAAGGALAQTQYTATSVQDVAAAAATAKTLSPTSNVKGKVFDRLAIVWLENTDYDLAAGDRRQPPPNPIEK